jgi:hypothetical protein
MSTPTMSRDGQHRIDMRATFRASINDLAGWLASSLRNVELERMTGPGNGLYGLTVKQIRNEIRNEMERRGTDGLETWSDRFSYDETVQRLALAEEHVRRAFPELDKADRGQKQQAAPVQVSAPAASEPSDTCSVCGKEECANEVCGTEPAKEIPAPAACRHGNTPRHDVTGDPIKACDDGFRDPGYVEFGAFSPEGCFYSGDGCAVDAANTAAEESEGEEDITWGRMCSDHSGEPASHCAECNAEPAATCADCSGKGCHWCHWTGKRR